LIRESQE